LRKLCAEPIDSFAGGVGLIQSPFDVTLDRPALDEQYHRVSFIVAILAVARFYLHQHAVRRAVEANGDWQAQAGPRGFENPMQSRAQLESKLWPHQIDDISDQGTAGRLQIAPGIVGQVQDPMRLIDQNAGRGELFDRLTVRNSPTQDFGRASRPYEMRILPARRSYASEQARQQTRLAGNGRRLVDACFAVERAEKSGRMVGPMSSSAD
jgi:hypothetical protein